MNRIRRGRRNVTRIFLDEGIRRFLTRGLLAAVLAVALALSALIYFDQLWAWRATSAIALAYP